MPLPSSATALTVPSVCVLVASTLQLPEASATTVEVVPSGQVTVTVAPGSVVPAASGLPSPSVSVTDVMSIGGAIVSLYVPVSEAVLPLPSSAVPLTVPSF